MEENKMCQIPAFGSWHYCEPLINAEFTPASFFGEEDLFKVPVAMPVNPVYLNGSHCRRKARKSEQMQRKQENSFEFAVGTPRRRRAPKAVDEDLYKIPQELLYQKPKRKRLLRNLLSGCIGLSCIP